MDSVSNNRNRNIIAILIALILLVIVVFEAVFIFTKKESQNSSSNTVEENKPVSRTMMIYLVGADLESKSGLASFELDSLNYNKINKENVNVILIAGGSSNWSNNYIDITETSIYKLENEGIVKIKEQPKQNMGDADVLTNFLSYVYNNYKTDKYDLIFWNHGGALLGSEFDELYDGDGLSLAEIEEGFADSPFNKNNKLETVMFETCLNGTLEMASSINNYADYMVASEEVTMGTPFTSVLDFINNLKQTDNAYDISRKFIKAYQNLIDEYKLLYVMSTGEEVYLNSTYSIVDLSKIDNLVTKVENFFANLNVNENYNSIARVRSNLLQYGNPEPAYDMVDLYNLVDGLKNISSSKSQDVLNAIKEAVVYNYATNRNSRGLSIYFPYNGDKTYQNLFLNIYKDLSKLKNYNNFIGKFNNIQNNTIYNYSFKQNEIKVDTEGKEADFTLKLTDEQLKGYAKAEYIVFKDNKDGYYLPIYRGKEVKLNGNTISANIKDRQLKVNAKNEEDETEAILTLLENESNDNYIEYQTTAILENFDDGNFIIDSAWVTLLYDKKTNQISISKIVLINDSDNLLPNNVAVDIKDYTHIAFGSSKYKILDDNGIYNDDWESNGVFEGFESTIDDFQFELKDLNDGSDYYCVFVIYDTTNNSYYSNLVKMNK